MRKHDQLSKNVLSYLKRTIITSPVSVCLKKCAVSLQKGIQENPVIQICRRAQAP